MSWTINSPFLSAIRLGISRTASQEIKMFIKIETFNAWTKKNSLGAFKGSSNSVFGLKY
ncbi:MAG: hypothetical protein ACM3SY_12550 [Candidatus Omnitrophota bacterium]